MQKNGSSAGNQTLSKQRKQDQEEEAKAKRVENTLSYIMLGIALLILILLIAIVFKACGVLNGTGSNTEQTYSTEQQRSTEPTTPESTEPSTEESTEPSTEESTEPSTEESTEESTSETVLVPDVLGENYLTAAEKVREAGLEVRYATEDTDEHDPYTIFKMSYEPGTELLRGTEVTLWIAFDTGTDVVIPGDIYDKDTEEARKILKELGFTVSETYLQQADNKVAAGKVVNSSPAMGALAPKGSAVTLVISTGPDEITLPEELWGISREEAGALLEKKGFDIFHIENSTEPVDSSLYPEDTVGKVEYRTAKDGEWVEMKPGDKISCKEPQAAVRLTMVGAKVRFPANILKTTDVPAAKAALEELGFKVETQVDPESTKPINTITKATNSDGSVSYAEGDPLMKGSTVVLWYSSHDDRMTVPEIKLGVTTLKEATSAISNANLTYAYIGGTPADMNVPVLGMYLEDTAKTPVSSGDRMDAYKTIHLKYKENPAPTEPPTEPTEPPTEPTEPPTEPTEPSTESSQPAESSSAAEG